MEVLVETNLTARILSAPVPAGWPALRVLGEAVTALMGPDRALMIITHFPRILETIRPDRVHVLSGGRIVRTGGMELALELEDRGYDWLKDEVRAAPAGRA